MLKRMRGWRRPLTVVCVCVWASLGGCASTDPGPVRAQIEAQVHTRYALPATDPSSSATADSRLQGTLTLERAWAHALLHAPEIRREWLRLGLHAHELDSARRPPNPALTLARRHAEPGPGLERSVGVSVPLGEWLLWPARARLADRDYLRIQRVIQARVEAVLHEVELHWLDAVHARQQAALASIALELAQARLDLVQRHVDAGTLASLRLAQEQAASARATLHEQRQQVRAIHTRQALATLLDLPADTAWSLPESLPAPPAHLHLLEVDTLLAQAHAQRPDLQALQLRLERQTALERLGARWRWLGHVEAGHESEREEGERLRGFELHLSLPLFDQGQAARGQDRVRSALAALDLERAQRGLEHQLEASVAALQVRTQMLHTWQHALLPASAAVLSGTEAQVNFMLDDAFALIAARQAQFRAWSGYMTAIADYWREAAGLRQLVGAPIPGLALPTAEDALPVRADSLLPAAPASQDHSHHHHHPHAPAAAQPPASPSTAPADHSHHRHEDPTP